MRRTVLRGLLVSSFLLASALPTHAAAQDFSAATPVAVQARGAGPQARAAVSPLQRPVTLSAANIRLGDALAAISQQADLALVYGNDLVPVNQQVSVRFAGTPAATALREVLAGANVDFTLAGGQQVVLTRRAQPATAARRANTTGTIAGRLTDAESGAAVPAADVWLDGTRWRTISTPQGRFVLTGVAPGTYTLRVRRIGYAAASQSVTVAADQSVTADFALRSVPTQLDEIVATVTGDQRIRELGHSVGRINADSIIREAPISNVSDLLKARVPGLQVFQTSGAVGGEINMRVRAPTSAELSTEPIVIVDGVRYTSGIVGTTNPIPSTPFNIEHTSRLNDLNPNDIESIEVVKGPSAATLYGTDAVNGVIVITTKAGRPGPARWRAYVRAGLKEMPKYDYAGSYWGWGHSNPNTNCTLANVARGSCMQDSVTVIPNPLNNEELTIFGAKPTWQYGTNVSGGTEDLRYYFSADFEEATGPMRMPAALVDELKEQSGGKPLKSQLEPNALSKVNLAANLTANLGKTATIRFNTGYTKNEVRQLSVGNPYNLVYSQASPSQDGYIGSTSPLQSFSKSTTEFTDRFYGRVTTEWRPLEWLSTRALVGVDLPGTQRYSLGMRDAWTNYKGEVAEERVRAVTTTGDLGATASFRRNQWSSRTSVGTQYVRDYKNRLVNIGSDLRPGGSAIIDAATLRVYQIYYETVTLGSYVEQMFGLNDRLFLTGAVRADGSSSFGNDYKAAYYPKAGLSWVASEEPFMPEIPGLDNLRVRYAFGASGQQPRPDMRRFNFKAGQSLLDNINSNKIIVDGIPSPDLRPERVREHEVGLDASALDSRVRLDLTWNYRQVFDQIRKVPMPAGMGSRWINVGYSTGHGLEALLSARVIESDLASWDVTVTHATNETKLIDRGSAPELFSLYGGLVEGYPIGARFRLPIASYEDVNGDGILQPEEVIMGDTPVYMGEGSPRTSQTLSTTLGFFNQKVRLSALFDRRSDFTVFNYIRMRQDLGGYSRAAVDPTTPWAQQAEIHAMMKGVSTGYFYIDQGDYTRLGEASIAVTLPDSWTRQLRLSNASLSLAGRNLGLWTKYSSADPESGRFAGNMGTYAENIPQSRDWVLRVDLGF
jgi:TonB-linked SusC/RagA family outer membrane protein